VPVTLDPRTLYLQYLEVFDRIAESLCRRHGLFGADAEDFVADVRLKLLEDDYSVIRKHRGDSNMTTFLSVVISNLFRDHRVKMWGKWRPSADARRLGPEAVLLETAVYRDGLSFEDACLRLEQSGQAAADRARLRDILQQLPYRPRRRIEGDEALEEVPAQELANGELLQAERQRERVTLEEALERAVGRLGTEDQVIIRMHYYEGLSIADIARGLQLPQKPLYARLKRLLGALSTTLSQDGIGPESLESLNPPAT
jgi:RNA polymerase sigma factor for flagellar operon FliA